MSKTLAALTFFIASSLNLQIAIAQQSAPKKAVIVTLDYDHSAFVTKVNSRVPPQGLLRALTQLNPADGAALLVNEEASLKRVADLMGILAKAGFVAPRVFYFGKDKGWMQEITYATQFQFSDDVSVLKPLPQPATKIQ